MASDATGSPSGSRRPRRRWSRLRLAMLLSGLACIVVGGALIAGPLYQVWQRGQTDQTDLNHWITGSPKSGSAAPRTLTCGSDSSSDYALVKFGVGNYGYAAVAGDGDWSMLNSRSMVHYHGSADPGQPGNMIIAFHREPDFEHIDQLGAGDIITIEDRSCHTFRYQVESGYPVVHTPSTVNELVPTSGNELTLITCTPWWVDDHRMVWRATLVPG